MAVVAPITCGKNQTLGFVVSCGEFLGFLRFLGDFQPEIFGFSDEKRDDFERKIVVKTWWLSGKNVVVRWMLEEERGKESE
jgi:hypothetical protein